MRELIKKAVLKKRSGNLNYIIPMMFIVIVVLLITYIFKLQGIRQGANKVDTCLTAANLAAATVDLNKYGEDKIIENTDFEKSFNDFKLCLKKNLNLNDNFSFKDETVFKGKVEIVDFRIYNIKKSTIQMVEITEKGNKIIKEFAKDVKTPDGVKIVTTTVYSKIKVRVKNIKGTEEVFKEKSVDVKRKGE